MPGLMGNAHPSIVPYQDFKTQDGHLIVAVGNDRQFARFAQLLGFKEWADNPDFKTNGARVRNRAKLIPKIADVMVHRTTDEWRETLNSERIPCGPINTIAQAFNEDTAKARGLAVEMNDPSAGTMKLVANPIKLSETPIRYHRPPPKLGEHAVEILTGFGFDIERIEALRDQGVIA